MKALFTRLFYAFGVFNQRAAVARSTYVLAEDGTLMTAETGEVITVE